MIPSSFEKCKAALGSYKVVRRFEEKMIRHNLHFTDNGRLDFKRYRCESLSPEELRRLPDFPCVIVFSEDGVPPLKCRFKRAMECLNEVLAVSGRVWILSGTRVIEIYNGTFTLCELR